MANSFIENVNTVANATALATGDIIEDATIARDEAEAYANAAANSADTSADLELLAEQWATKAYNNPVEEGKFSAYHWSVVAQENSGDSVIQDLLVSENSTWSSTKIKSTADTKAAADHLHTGVYEPAIGTKGTAFNKEFVATGGEGGTSITVARGDHNHAETYEPKIAIKNTAFNKNFGTASGTVAEGDHDHELVYMPYSAVQTAYNKAFVLDVNAPLSTEIPRGNHSHTATGVTFDPTGLTVATSGTAQGAIGQLDSVVGSIEISEKTNISTYLTTSPSTVTIATASTPVKITSGMTTMAGYNHALESGGALVIDYDIVPDNFIEGWFSITLSIDRAANTVYQAALYKNDVILGDGFLAEIGTTSSAAGPNQISLDAYITGLENGDELSVYVSNETDTTNVTVNSFTMSFSGAPEGAITATGLSVDHSDLTGTGAASGVHTIADISGDSTTLQEELDARATLAVPSAANNLAMLDALGDLVDSGVAYTDIGDHMSLVGSPVLDNIVTMTSGGDSKDSTYSISDLALNAGDNTVNFKVAAAVDDDDAVRKSDMNAMAANYVLDTTYSSHTASANPHGTTYTDVGAAATVHTHAQTDITGLSDSFDNKYDKISGAAENNVTAFSTSGLLKDSGLAYTDIVVDADIADMVETSDIANMVESDTTGITGADAIANMVSLTQAEYDAIVTPDASTFYVIVG